MSRLEVFLDEGPGETRGVIARGGRYEHLLIARDDDPAATRLGARSVGRIASVEAGLSGCFVELTAGETGFLPLKGGAKATVGEKIEVEVTAEPRGGKGASLRRLGAGEGEPRLIAAGPTIREQLAILTPGVEPQGGAAAIQAGIEAQEEALTGGGVIESAGLDVQVERTRGLIAVDLDMTPGARGPRQRANAAGIAEAARLIRLKRWGGLVVFDLIGGAQDGAPVLQAAKAAFPEPGVVAGPVSKLGVFHLSLPWRRTPIEEVLFGDAAARASTEALTALAALRRALLTETGQARITLVCAPGMAERVGVWVQALGPRAALKAEAALSGGQYRLESG